MTKKWWELEDIFTGQMDSDENNRYICGRECELQICYVPKFSHNHHHHTLLNSTLQLHSVCPN